MKIIFFFLLSTFCFAQIKHTTFDSETGKILPFVSVFKNDSLVSISNKKGVILLTTNNYTYKKDGYFE